jgi:hypothetical protein
VAYGSRTKRIEIVASNCVVVIVNYDGLVIIGCHQNDGRFNLIIRCQCVQSQAQPTSNTSRRSSRPKRASY